MLHYYSKRSFKLYVFTVWRIKFEKLLFYVCLCVQQLLSSMHALCWIYLISILIVDVAIDTCNKMICSDYIFFSRATYDIKIIP